ncbi:glycosyltransferase [Aureliella helgolandensis]|uniref:Glycosyltransferase subfamily 4-like N-terminal domain-containing protein n=1 Tax=Aureliella helgolandensis TaxID=2527968 RepID=A0A518GBY5_9BACT|nr:glycosyltransferase [Aureliella helgolandensis]QDV26131.1 hypothetical protein Q31a_45030 [Aureliella helgolandensis]
MKLLVISHFYPPLNRMASSRPLGWAQLGQKLGHSVTVLTSAKHEFHGPLSLLPDTSGATLIEVEYPLVGLMKRLPSELLRKVAFRVLKFLWLLRALALVLFDPRLKGVDVVISTYSPVSTILLGYAYRKLRRKCVWVVDYRDLWTDNSYRAGRGRLAEWYGRKVQRVLLRAASLITTVSESLRDQLRKLVPDKPVTVIYNGFDALDDAEARVTTADHEAKEDACKIVYTGTIYTGKRSPEPLFKAVNELLLEGKITRTQLQLEFLGDRLGNVPQLLKSYDLESCAHCPGQLSRELSYQSQRNASLLLMLGSNDPGILTGKIFEYLAAEKPILALGDEADSAVGKLLSSTGCGVAVGTDVEEIKSLVSALVREKRFDPYAPIQTEVDRYSRDSQGKALFEQIAELQDAPC